MTPAAAVFIAMGLGVAIWLVWPARHAPRVSAERSGSRSWLTGRFGSRSPRLTDQHLRRDAAVLLRQFAALVDSGRSEAQAWSDVYRHWQSRQHDHPFTEVCATVTAAEHSGLGASYGLSRAAEQAQNPQVVHLVHRLQAVTALSEQTGTALSRLVEQLAHGFDAAGELASSVQTAVAGPRLTQNMLTVLPIGAIGLGHLMGASPLVTMISHPVGWACLILGVTALLSGRAWSARMIHQVKRHV